MSIVSSNYEIKREKSKEKELGSRRWRARKVGVFLYQSPKALSGPRTLISDEFAEKEKEVWLGDHNLPNLGDHDDRPYFKPSLGRSSGPGPGKTS